MRVYQTKAFARFARKARLSKEALLGAAVAVAEGRWDADLGGGVFKQRIAREGSGKSGCFRTILAIRAERRAFFVHGFAKNEKGNVSAAELRALKALAVTLLGLDERALAAARAAGEIEEIGSHDETEDGTKPNSRHRPPNGHGAAPGRRDRQGDPA